jgi:hypothetical protein
MAGGSGAGRLSLVPPVHQQRHTPPARQHTPVSFLPRLPCGRLLLSVRAQGANFWQSAVRAGTY